MCLALLACVAPENLSVSFLGCFSCGLHLADLHHLALTLYDGCASQDLMQITKLPFLTRECPLHKKDRKAPVSSLLRGEPENSLRYLRRRESQASVEALLQDCSHNGFPIVSETGQLVGLVRRSELEGCLLEGQEEVQLDVLADPAPYTVHKDFPVDRAYLLFRDLVPPFFI